MFPFDLLRDCSSGRGDHVGPAYWVEFANEMARTYGHVEIGSLVNNRLKRACTGQMDSENFHLTAGPSFWAWCMSFTLQYNFPFKIDESLYIGSS